MSDTDFSWPGRVQGNPAHDLIIAYLTIDIQKSPKWVEGLLQQIKAIQSGRIPSWERTGNAYCLRIYPNYVEIEEEYGEESGALQKIPLADFEAAVIAWQELIRNNSQ